MCVFVVCLFVLTTFRCFSADTHLIVACDGLWDVVNDQEVCDLLLNKEEGDTHAQALANRLLTKALKQGTTDNISIQVILL